MSTKTTNTFNINMVYQDFSERTYKLPLNGDWSQETHNQAINQIQAFNTAAQNDASSVSQTFLSDGGSRVVRIKSAILVEKTEEEIYSG